MSKFPVALLLVVGSAFVPRPAFAEAKCPAGDAPIFEEDLRATPTCEAAYKLHDACSWGSSGDANLSGVVIEKCEAVFLNPLSPSQKRNYQARQQRCSNKYASEDGSLAIAEASLCAEAIAVSFARNAAAAGRIPAAPLAPVRASFDCGKARTKLELLICSSDVIGDEDIDLPRRTERLSTARPRTPAWRWSPARTAGSLMWRSRASGPRLAIMSRGAARSRRFPIAPSN
jgi:hypothetical protein